MCVQMSSEPCLRRRRFSRVLKPLLPRKLTSSARINLNRHWNELEEMYGGANTTHTTRSHSLPFESLVLHNELNDNAINAAREAGNEAVARALEKDAIFEATDDGVVLETPPSSPLPHDDDILETPPSSPNPFFPSAFDMVALVIKDLRDLGELPLTPDQPLPWDVFAFPAEASNLPPPQ